MGLHCLILNSMSHAAPLMCSIQTAFDSNSHFALTPNKMCENELILTQEKISDSSRKKCLY